MNFYETDAWIKLRYQFLRTVERRCVCCGSSNPKAEYHVDHIKPRSKYPNLALDIRNLQLLCKLCNLGKSNDYEDDWKNKLAPKFNRIENTLSARKLKLQSLANIGIVTPKEDADRFLMAASDYEPFESHLPESGDE